MVIAKLGAMPTSPFTPYLQRWALLADGQRVRTPTSQLLPVLARQSGEQAMLKIALIDEEKRGNKVLIWRGGHGAARVLAHHGAAVLLERLWPTPDLSALAQAGPQQDDQALQILCGVAGQWHAPNPAPMPDLPTLHRWFQALERQAAQTEGFGRDIFQHAWTTARHLLDTQTEQVVLHGDLHHGNVMHCLQRGWLAIDPKGLWGERAFDYANILLNPAAERVTATRLQRQIELMARLTGHHPTRLRQWTAAYAALKAAWHLQEGSRHEAAVSIDIAELLLNADRSGEW